MGEEGVLFGLVWHGLVGDIRICFKDDENHTSLKERHFSSHIINQEPKDYKD